MARALVVYESMFGNTQSVAEAIADGLGSVPGVEVDLVEVGRAAAPLADLDLLVLGAPTHALTLPRAATRKDAAGRRDEAIVSAGTGVREWLAGTELAGARRAATFDTRVKKPFLPGSAARAARRLLVRRGVEVVDTESFWVADLLGPLKDGELERARRWGVGLASAVHVAA